MSHFSDSDDDDGDEIYGKEYCARIAASLESKLTFAGSHSASDQEEGAWQRGGAKKYTTFHVDSFEEDNYYSDEFECVTLCSDQPQNHDHVPDHTLHCNQHLPHSDFSHTPPDHTLHGSQGTSGFPGEATGEFPTAVEEDWDDGWNSDGEEFPLLATPTNVRSVYRTHGYGEWEDEVWAEFETSWRDKPEKVLSLMREMFEEHMDIHDLLCYFLRGLGRRRPNTKKHALYKALLDEFQKWKENSSGNLSKNAVLTVQHQKEVLSVFSRGNTTYLDSLTSIFQLRAAPVGDLVKLVRQVLEVGHLKEGVMFIYTFEIQQHFSMEQTLLPLVALDKINLIENYIDSNKELQIKFTSLLDKLCETGKTIHLLSLYLGDCKWVDSEAFLSPNSKLNAKQLLKLGLRFIVKYNLDLDVFPNLSMKKCSSFIHHLLSLHYVEGSVTEENRDDLLVSAVMGKEERVQLQLVCELLQFNDIPAATRWALKCGLPTASLPYPVQTYMTSHKQSLRVKGRTSPVKKDVRNGYLRLGLPLSAVTFVDSRQSLQSCWEVISKYGAVIGIDSEWKLICETSKERLAVLQLAVKDQVFLLDMITLPLVTTPKTLRHFMHNLFGSKHNLKLGYSVGCDLKMLMKSWPFVSDIVSDPERLVDLKTVDEMVERLKNPSHSNQHDPEATPTASKATPTGSDMPLHPLYHMVATADPLPLHPLLANQTKPLPQAPVAPTPVYNVPVDVDGDTQATPTNGWGKSPSGLSSLVERYLGRPLDKSQQLSDWERRPLRQEQVRYAALDAHCLLAVYEHLGRTGLTLDPNFVTPYFRSQTNPDTPTAE